MNQINPTLIKLIKILNDGKFHSGTALGEALAISRNAVWKNIKQLIAYNVNIESIQRKGYQLKQPLILLNSKLIKSQINYSGKLKIDKIEILNSIPSTNDYLKTKSFNKINQLYFCLAEHQSAGKGRMGSSWFSPFGTNIYLSVKWYVDKDISKLSGLSLVAGLAVAEVLTQYQLREKLKIKWPNEIFWQDKKLAGVLTEINAENHGITQIIIGIGVNINMPENYINNQPWTSLNSILNSHQDRNKFAADLINYLTANLEKLSESGFQEFIPLWEKFDYLKNKKITLMIGDNVIQGKAIGINEIGHLILEQTNKQKATYSSGQVTVQV